MTGSTRSEAEAPALRRCCGSHRSAPERCANHARRTHSRAPEGSTATRRTRRVAHCPETTTAAAGPFTPDRVPRRVRELAIGSRALCAVSAHLLTAAACTLAAGSTAKDTSPAALLLMLLLLPHTMAESAATTTDTTAKDTLPAALLLMLR